MKQAGASDSRLLFVLLLLLLIVRNQREYRDFRAGAEPHRKSDPAQSTIDVHLYITDLIPSCAILFRSDPAHGPLRNNGDEHLSAMRMARNCKTVALGEEVCK